MSLRIYVPVEIFCPASSNFGIFRSSDWIAERKIQYRVEVTINTLNIIIRVSWLVRMYVFRARFHEIKETLKDF